MVRQVPPWSGNVKKRLVKSPKIYIRDTGILHSLLNISSLYTLMSNPALGASWEAFVIENILNSLDTRWQYSYYRTATQIEIDLVLETPDGEVWAIEIKRNSAPKVSKGFIEACKDVKATHKWIVNAQEDTYPVSDGIEVIGFTAFIKLISDKNNSLSL